VASARAEGLRPLGFLVDEGGEEKEFWCSSSNSLLASRMPPLRRKMDWVAGEEGAGDEVPFL